MARKHGITEATALYEWKALYGGMSVSETRRLKALEEGNKRLKKPLAEQMLDATALRRFLQKRQPAPPIARCSPRAIPPPKKIRDRSHQGDAGRFRHNVRATKNTHPSLRRPPKTSVEGEIRTPKSGTISRSLCTN